MIFYDKSTPVVDGSNFLFTGKYFACETDLHLLLFRYAFHTRFNKRVFLFAEHRNSTIERNINLPYIFYAEYAASYAATPVYHIVRLYCISTKKFAGYEIPAQSLFSKIEEVR